MVSRLVLAVFTVETRCGTCNSDMGKIVSVL